MADGRPNGRVIHPESPPTEVGGDSIIQYRLLPSSGGLQTGKATRRSLTYWVRLSISAAIFVGSLAGAEFLTGYLGTREPYRSLIVIATGLVMGLLAFSIALIASKMYNR